MLDLAFVRDNLTAVEDMLRRRGMDPAQTLGGFRQADERRRRLITQAETLKAQRNKLSEEIAKLKKTGQNEAAATAMEQAKALREQGEALEKQAGESDQELKNLLALIPNMLHESVPTGKSADDNVEVRRWGRAPEFSFTPKPHWELGEQLGVLDLERAVKLSGARFAVYWDLGARMERALANFMLDLHTREHGYTEVLPPYLVNSASMYGTGQLPKFAQEQFKTEQQDLWLIPTAEVPLTNLYRDEVIDVGRLPLSVTAYTPCFRYEAFSHGKDVRGIIRQYQFQKVELVKFTRPDQSYEEHERLTRHAETVLQKLGLPYRVIVLCSADTGSSPAKTYDLEVWLPGQQLYREISSCSNFEAYQARRANIRWRPEGSKKSEYVHTLNGSGLAIGRTWLAILENYQQADGSVIVPEVLRPYMGAERITAKKF
jgi:seryl-tRNA synthetase